MNAKEIARGKWPSILKALCLDDQFLTGKHTACPICGGQDRFRFSDYRGNGDWICNQCGSGDGFDLVMQVNGMSFPEVAKEIESMENIPEVKPAPKPNPRSRLRRVQSGVKRCTGDDPASVYLKNRGLKWTPYLSYHPSMVYYDNKRISGTYPAMIATVVNVDGKPITYHVTYLENGRKANVESPKKILQPIESIKGAAVRLGSGTEICVTEGIETALAVQQAYNKPVWAALSANGIESLCLPPHIDRVIIFGDNDKNFTGQAAVYELAKRLNRGGIEVDVRLPETRGHDFHDQLCGSV